MLDEELCDTGITPLCQMKRGRPTVVLGCPICTVLDEERCEIEMTQLRRVMKGSPPKLILGCSVGAVPNKELRKIVMAPL
jgi:hypothetical protein